MGTVFKHPKASGDFPPKKKSGVTVETSHGRALTFGVSKDRTEKMLATLAARKYRELSKSMHEQKAARLKSHPGK